MRGPELIQLSDSCNRSTNLELDFEDPARLRDLYVSSKFQTELGEILASVLDTRSNRRVRVLSGSPGLGKSTFALFAAQALSKRRPKALAEKLKKSNPALKERFRAFQASKNARLLPVFINGYEGRIEEAFANKLRLALLREGLPAPRRFNSALKFYQKSISLLRKKGYGGSFAVYDEFGKYLERAVHDPASLDMQFLQNFAEFCDRSNDGQCHLTLITHLSISRYAGRLPFNIQREWAKIEGRFQESAFYDKSADYYKLISSVFKKNIAQTAPAMARKHKSYIKRHISSFKADGFEGFIASEGAEKTLLSCFPLHPAVVALLPHLSMKVAQNERTLYTFLTRDEACSLKRFLEGRFQDETTLVKPYDLYQYFSPLIGNDVGIGGSYKIQLMAEIAFAKIGREDEASKQIVSLLALCSVIKNSRLAPLTEEFVSSCFSQDFSPKEIQSALKSLRRAQVVFYNKKARQYLLQEGSPVDIDEEMAKLKSHKLTGAKLVQILKRYFKPDFIIPKKYNFDHAITRFYRTEIISVEELRKIKTGKALDFRKEDGRVFYVIPFSHDELDRAKREIQKITAPLAVFALPQKFIECKKDIEALSAVERLYNNKDILSASPLVKKELDRHKDILLSSLRSLLRPLIGHMNLSAEAVYPGESSLKGKRAAWLRVSHFKELERFLGAAFKREYSKYIRFNLEYINRHSVSGSAALGRKRFVDFLMSRKAPSAKDIESLGCGPGYAILSAMKRLSRFKFSERENIYSISPRSEYFQFFKEYQAILSSRPGGLKGSELMGILTAPPYGLRLGVIPVFAALADLCLKQPVSHYFDSAYVKDPDGNHYDLMMKYPGKTAIHYTPIDSKRQKLLDGLGAAFGAKGGSIRAVLEALLRWRKSVPESTKQAAGLSSPARRLLIQIDSSKAPEELLFSGLPECLGQGAGGGQPPRGQISRTIALAEKHKKEIDCVYKALLLKIKSDLLKFIEFIGKECFNSLKGASAGGRGNLAKNFQDALSQAKNYPLSAPARRFVGRALSFDSACHHQYFLETMADVLTGSSPRYWDSSGYSKFEFALKKIKMEIELACEIAHPAFKGQSVLAFIDRGAERKTFLKLGAVSGGGPRLGVPRRLSREAERIKAALASFDEADRRKIILSVLESLGRGAEDSSQERLPDEMR